MARLGGLVYYHLATGAQEGAKFFKIIDPYIHKSMRYKVDLRYSYSSYAGRRLRFGTVIQSDLSGNTETTPEMRVA